MSFSEYFLLIVTTLVIGIITVKLSWLIWKSKGHCFSYVIFSIVLSILLNEIIPSITCFLVGPPDYYNFLKPGSWVVGQFISLVYLLLLFSFIKQRQKHVGYFARLLSHLLKYSYISRLMPILFIFSVIGRILYPQEAINAGFTAASWPLRYGYTYVNILSALFVPFGGLLYPLLAVNILLLSNKKEKYNSFYRLQNLCTNLFICTAIFFLIRDVLMGARGTLIFFVFPLICLIWLKYDKTKAIILLVIFVIIFVPLSAAVLTYRDNPDLYIDKDIKTRLTNLKQVFNMEPNLNYWFSEIKRLVYRFDGVPNGGNLVLYIHESGFVNIRPYLGTIVGFIPRALWSEKPYPKSFDGTPGGIPQWLSGRISGRPWLSTSVSVPAIAYCHFGLIGVLIFAFLHVYLICILAYIGDRLARPDVFLLLWFVIRPLDSLDSIILNIIQWIIPIAFIIACIRLLSARR